MLTDKDIIKALECCGFDEDMCLDCPIQCDCEKDTEAMVDRAKAILDLINRQQAEISVKRKLLEKAEETIGKQQAEIERLKEDRQLCLDEVIKTREIYNQFKKVDKADAIKEFAERLKENCRVIGAPLITNRIDNLVKEMVGEE